MKKQINPTIKAHLIRGAFYLLLLLAVCAIPFALAQSRSRESATAAAKPDAAGIKYPLQNAPAVTGAIGAMLLRRPTLRKPRSRRFQQNPAVPAFRSSECRRCQSYRK